MAEDMIRQGRNSPMPAAEAAKYRAQAIRDGGPSLHIEANKDNKFVDVLVSEPQKVQPLHKNLRNGIEDPNAHQNRSSA